MYIEDMDCKEKVADVGRPGPDFIRSFKAENIV